MDLRRKVGFEKLDNLFGALWRPYILAV